MFTLLSVFAVLPGAGGPWNTLDELLVDVSPDVTKWASVVIVTEEDGRPRFEWHHFDDSADAVNFWPASAIKIYTVVAALEYLNELGLDTDCTLSLIHI